MIMAKVPDTITSWIASAFAMSDAAGLGVSKPTSLKVFQPFFVSLTLPYSVIRGEEVSIITTVFNYENKCLTVSVNKLYLPCKLFCCSLIVHLSMLSPVYTIDFCHGTQCNFCHALRCIKFQTCSKLRRYRGDNITGGLRDKNCIELRDKNRLCTRGLSCRGGWRPDVGRGFENCNGDY